MKGKKVKITVIVICVLLALTALFRVSMYIFLQHGGEPDDPFISDGVADFALTSYYFIGDIRIKNIASENYHPSDDEMRQFQDQYLEKNQGVDPQKIDEHTSRVLESESQPFEERFTQISNTDQVKWRLVQRVHIQIKKDYENGTIDAWTALYALNNANIPQLK